MNHFRFGGKGYKEMLVAHGGNFQKNNMEMFD